MWLSSQNSSPSQLSRRADELLALIPSTLEPARADFVAAHLRALECAGRKFAGEPVGFVDEVSAYFDVSISKGDPGAVPRGAYASG